MKLFAQETATVYKNFKWKDLIDIDRKWSREFERVNKRWIYHYGYGFLDYLWGLGDVEGIQSRHTRYASYVYEWKMDSTKAAVKNRKKFMEIKAKIESEEFKEMDALSGEGRMYLFHRLPVEEIETAVLGLANVIDIVGSDVQQYEYKYDKGGKIVDSTLTKGKNDLIFDLEDRINDASNTYLTSQRLLATIKMERTNVEGQRATLQQIQSNLAHFYARVQMMDIEERAAVQKQSADILQGIVRANSKSKIKNTTWEPDSRNSYDDAYSVTSQVWEKD